MRGRRGCRQKGQGAAPHGGRAAGKRNVDAGTFPENAARRREPDGGGRCRSVKRGPHLNKAFGFFSRPRLPMRLVVGIGFRGRIRFLQFNLLPPAVSAEPQNPGGTGPCRGGAGEESRTGQTNGGKRFGD